MCSVLAAALTACSVYDESRIRFDPQHTAGKGAAAAGTGGTGGTGSVAAGASGAAGNPNGTACGDGLVDESEKCDTGVLEGSPGWCPSVCSAPACSTAQITGSGCQTECRIIELGCKDDDGCCPAACSSKDDSDCSGMCGDGVVQSDLAETCENATSESRCPTAADCDDEDACTTDALSGSGANCNASCTHAPITTPQNGDGCCPAGADANSDGDCQPRCGNGVREGDEACDGTAACDESCKLTSTDAQAMCLETFGGSECERCACMRCTEDVLACSSSGDASRDQACTAVTRCAIEAGCAGDACYCGDAPFGPCAFRANGACKSAIESAAGTTVFSQIQAQGDDPSSVLGRSITFGECRRAQCAQECR
jgi:hypothetical protein